MTLRFWDDRQPSESFPNTLPVLQSLVCDCLLVTEKSFYLLQFMVGWKLYFIHWNLFSVCVLRINLIVWPVVNVISKLNNLRQCVSHPSWIIVFIRFLRTRLFCLAQIDWLPALTLTLTAAACCPGSAPTYLIISLSVTAESLIISARTQPTSSCWGLQTSRT